MAKKKPPVTIPPPPPEPVRPGHQKSNRRTAERDKGSPSNRRADGLGSRPQFNPTDEQRNIVTVMVAGGIQQEEIAAAIGISKPTLAKHFKTELKHGLARANAQVVAHLFKQTKDNVRAVEFWLTNRDQARWAHKNKVEGSLDLNMSLEDLVLGSMGKEPKKKAK